MSIKPISEQSELITGKLFVFDKLKDVETIGELTNLRKLTVSKLTLKNLDFLTTLNQLAELNFMLGSLRLITENFTDKIGVIEKMSFTRVKQLTKEHLMILNEMKYLKELTFDTQANIFDLDWLIRLRQKYLIVRTLMNKSQHTTMYIQNRRNSSKFKGCSPLQHRIGLISLKHAIAYFAYTHRWRRIRSAPLLQRAGSESSGVA